MKSIEINGRPVGPGHPCFIIAEAGVNHDGKLDMARQLVDVAKAGGADAVKFQTFNAAQIVSSASPKAAYQVQRTDPTESQFEMLRRLQLSPEEHRELHAYCQERSVLFLSTPFDEASADLLADLGLPAFKIGSGEITNWPFLEHVARKGRPLILSTGMSYLSEVDEAVRVLLRAGCDQLVLLHCASVYPAHPADVNLRAMLTMYTAFGLPVGYSDHTSGIEVSLAAVAVGACVIEKHFTLDRRLPGPDHLASLEPEEFASMVRGIRTVEACLGHGRKEPVEREQDTRALMRKSLVAACDIPAGATVTPDMICIKRPGTGLPPSVRPFFIGRIARTVIPLDTLLTLEMVE